MKPKTKLMIVIDITESTTWSEVALSLYTLADELRANPAPFASEADGLAHPLSRDSICTGFTVCE